MTRLDQRERRVALWASGVAAATWLVLLGLSGFRATAAVMAGVGLVLSGLLALAARRGNRLLTGLAAVALAFGPWGQAYLLGFPYNALAAWLLVRGMKAKARAAEAAQAAPGEPEQALRRERPPVKTRTGRPTANKRYTPPRRGTGQTRRSRRVPD